MKTVLLIEDDSALRESTAELLELSNYNVISAPNGRIGIEQAKKVNPDVVVCDIMMPEIDGYGVLEALSQNPVTSNIPFIFLSAKTEHKEIRKGMNLGADDYLTKPFEEEELVSAIESRIAKAIIISKNLEQKNTKEEPEEDFIRNLNELKNFFDDNGESLSFKKGDDFVMVSGEVSPGIRTAKVTSFKVADAAHPFGVLNYTVLALYLLISVLNR